jgi:hypothetical protein
MIVRKSSLAKWCSQPLPPLAGSVADHGRSVKMKILIPDSKMPPFVDRLLKKFEVVLDRLFGCLGGLICAFVASLMAFYVRGVFHYHFLLWVAACIASLFVFSLLGLIWPRYFLCLAIPVFNGFSNADDMTHLDDHSSWKEWLASLELFLALIALMVGALFQIHLIFAVGVFLFIGYAILAPRIFSDKKWDNNDRFNLPRSK